jgi:hypothetical protein
MPFDPVSELSARCSWIPTASKRRQGGKSVAGRAGNSQGRETGVPMLAEQGHPVHDPL